MCYSTELRLLQNAIHPYNCHAGLIFAQHSYLEAARLLEEKGRSAQVVKLNSISPLDVDTVAACSQKTGRLVVAEECVDAGCVGRRLAAELALRGVAGLKLALVNLGDRFVRQGTVAELRALCGIDGVSIARRALEVMDGG